MQGLRSTGVNQLERLNCYAQLALVSQNFSSKQANYTFPRYNISLLTIGENNVLVVVDRTSLSYLNSQYTILPQEYHILEHIFVFWLFVDDCILN